MDFIPPTNERCFKAFNLHFNFIFQEKSTGPPGALTFNCRLLMDILSQKIIAIVVSSIENEYADTMHTILTTMFSADTTNYRLAFASFAVMELIEVWFAFNLVGREQFISFLTQYLSQYEYGPQETRNRKLKVFREDIPVPGSFKPRQSYGCPIM